jgi:Patatin-like phospholipase
MAVPPRADDARLKQLFPDVADDPPPRTFELGMVLGGTVSAGAYTAGALDFLLEALEAWHADPKAPHRVVVKTAAGTSGGAVCASILGLLSSRVVPHVSKDETPPGQDANPLATTNPLWDLWVNDFQIAKLLTTDDLGQDADAGSGIPTADPVQHVPALINCTMIDQSGAKLAAIGTSPGTTLGYFAAPFRAAVTLANLRGIPYQVRGIPSIMDFTGAAFVQHDDFAWFAFPNGASHETTATSIGKREDEFWLDDGNAASGFAGYGVLVAYATASAAMPLGLAARALVRPAEHYYYRPQVQALPEAPGYKVRWPDPGWTNLTATHESGIYTFTSVDGGTFNNDPVALVHTALAGVIGRNPSDSSSATRAMFMVDPLADKPLPIGNVGKSLFSVVKNIVPTFIAESRYRTADMELFANDDVYSRYQLVPFRPQSTDGPAKVGEPALAGTSLFAAAGWCCRAFRAHDFLLGRHNMQAYLQRELMLKADNPLFDGWTLDQRKDWARGGNFERIDVEAATPPKSYYLPILPDVTQRGPLPLPVWPKGQYNPDTLTPMLKTRLKAVIGKLVDDNLTGALPWLLKVLAVPGVVDTVAEGIVGDFRKELVDAGLL